MLKGRDVELVCGACEGVFARVHVRPVALGMDVHSIITGAVLMPRPGYSINEEARQRLAKAERATDKGDSDARGELDAAWGVAQYLRRQGGDIVYDLSCWCRRRYVRTSPDLYRAVRVTKGHWLTLSPATATWPPGER
ncbi:MAG TPA: hypothetical protein VFW65_19850 [Pseudonocardiaceae bacterium]|nr:hypothetical protein [Pseudonocardiaceae bacterium]